MGWSLNSRPFRVVLHRDRASPKKEVLQLPRAKGGAPWEQGTTLGRQGILTHRQKNLPSLPSIADSQQICNLFRINGFSESFLE